MEQKTIETNADQAFAHGSCSKKRVINIQPITRIEGHARIAIQLDDEGNVADTRLNIMALRGFEKFIEGRPAEEVPRIVNRICGICPWMHHTASNKAVDGCFQGPGAAHGHQTPGTDAGHGPDQRQDPALLLPGGAGLRPGRRGRLRRAQRPGHRPGRPGAGQAGGEDAPGRPDDDRKVRRQGHPPGGGGARRLRQVHDRGRAPGTPGEEPGAAGVRPVLHRLRQE